MSSERLELGEFIRLRREYLGMSQDELGELIGAPRSYISQIETGAKKWPRSYISRLAIALRVSEDRLRDAAGRPTLHPQMNSDEGDEFVAAALLAAAGEMIEEEREAFSRPIAPGSLEAEIIKLVRRVHWNDERASGIRLALTNYIELDRKKRKGEG